MPESEPSSNAPWIDEDDPPEWTEEHIRYGQLSIGGKVVREAVGTWTNPGGRPPIANPKRQVTLRLDPEVIDRFRATGKGWQTRINAELRKALGL